MSGLACAAYIVPSFSYANEFRSAQSCFYTGDNTDKYVVVLLKQWWFLKVPLLGYKNGVKSRMIHIIFHASKYLYGLSVTMSVSVSYAAYQ